MIHEKILKFTHNDINFEAIVEYNDEPFGNYRIKKSTIYYQVNLVKPIKLSCGGCQIMVQNSIDSLKFNSQKYRECRYIYNENEVLESENNVTNIYPTAKEMILYKYFNKNVIEKINKQIQKFDNEIDEKYSSEIESVKQEKAALKKRFKANEFDNKKYQKLLTPTRKKKDDLEYKVWELKFEHERSFFDGSLLKDKYREDLITNRSSQ